MRFTAFLMKIAADRKGATAIEYGLIASLVVIAIIGSLNIFAGETIGLWSTVETEMTAANAANV